MDFWTFALVVLAWLTVVVLVGFALIVWREVATQRALQDARARIATSRRMKDVRRGKKQVPDDEADADDLPEWVHGLAQGAGIDIAAVLDGDQAQLAKVQAIIDAKLKGGAPNGGGARDDYV